MHYQRIVSVELSLSEWDVPNAIQIITRNMQQFGIMYPVEFDYIKLKSILQCLIRKYSHSFHPGPENV